MNAWRADPLVWGHGPRVFEVFLEPTCPFSEAGSAPVRCWPEPRPGGRGEPMRLNTSGQPMLRYHTPIPALMQRMNSMPSPKLPRTLFIDRVASPIGTMLLIHDPEERVRALDFHDCEARMRRLLR